MDAIEESLTHLISAIPGATMAALLGMDGVGVQVALSDAWQEVDPEVLEIELASLAEAVQKAAGGIQSAPSTEFFLGTARADFLGMAVDPAYFLVVGLEPGGDLGRARQSLDQARETLAL